MRFLLMAALFIGQASVSIPRETADTPGRATQNIKNHTNRKQSKPAAAPAVKDATAADENKGRAHEERSADKERPVHVGTLPPINVTKDWRDKTYWWLTVSLVLVGIATLCAIWYQARETARAAKAAEISAKATERSLELVISKERAKLRIAVDTFKSQPVIAGGFPSTFVIYKILNHGITKAVAPYGEIGATVDEQAAPNPSLDIPRPIGNLPPSFEPDNALDCSIDIFPRQLGEDDFQSVADGKLFVRVFGSVKYRDIFDADRETKFYLRWKPFMKGIKDYGSWERIGPPEANRET